MEPGHLSSPPVRGTFLSRRRDVATLRLHLNNWPLGEVEAVTVDTLNFEPSGGFGGELTVVARLPNA
jgi:hypothetical protein